MSDERNTSAKPHILCDRCRGVIGTIQAHFQEFSRGDQTKSGNPFRINHGPVHEVQASGLKGCHFCSIVSQKLCPAHFERDISPPSGSFITCLMSFNRKGSKVVASADAWLKGAEGNRLVNATLFIESDIASSSSNQPVAASWSVSTGSDAALDLASKWLHHCISNHNLCEEIRLTPASTNKSPFPTFLVDLGGGSLRLCRTENLLERPKYLTLSHRWGGSHIFQLTSANLVTLLSSLPLDSLPKTFREAIFITRKLGYQYLWIDSLCIIQDSKEHWQTESAIMGDIYRGSTCTIAALGATDGDSGCFRTRNPLCFQPCKFELDTGRIVQLTAGTEKKSLGLTGYGPQVEPLHERAWVMQEWMLSPRILHYGTFGLYWECVTGSANDHNPEIWTNPTPQYTIHQTCSLTLSGELDESYKAFWRWWSRIISMYNPCGLTYGTDKLVAITGIVKLVESRTGLYNIAGLWKEFIFPELLWYTGKPTKRPVGGYQAPTWSWASLNSEVSPGIQDFNYTFHWKVELLEAFAQLVAANGQISSAHIRVRGLLQLVRWEEVENGYKLRWGDKHPEENGDEDNISFMPDILPDAGQELWALHIVYASSSTTWMNMGLVVTKKDVEGKQWVRIGSFRQYDWSANTTEFFQDDGAQMTELVIV